MLYTERMNVESQLSSTDYRVIKCAEAKAAGASMPYDAKVLHQQRQQWRQRINEIEAELAQLDATEPELSDPAENE